MTSSLLDLLVATKKHLPFQARLLVVLWHGIEVVHIFNRDIGLASVSIYCIWCRHYSTLHSAAIVDTSQTEDKWHPEIKYQVFIEHEEESFMICCFPFRDILT